MYLEVPFKYYTFFREGKKKYRINNVKECNNYKRNQILSTGGSAEIANSRHDIFAKDPWTPQGITTQHTDLDISGSPK